MREPARITAFLVKVASRCNLDCDYCYVYHHSDQSWRGMPRFLSERDRTAFADQLGVYVREANIERCLVVFHGGEPLLAGASSLVEFAQALRHAATPQAQVDVALQTNGLLLTDEVLAALADANIGVSLSLDGPKAVNDLHRTTRRGRSSFDRVKAAVDRLKRYPSIFAGIIAVIDPRAEPSDLFAFFDETGVSRLDLLLPDSHHLRPPPSRDADLGIYQRWLIEAFDLWFDRYAHIQVRTFEALLDSVVGLPSRTDAFGLGDVSLLTIETDGTYHDLDVLKVVGQGATALKGSVCDTTISTIAGSEAISTHRRMLSKEGVSSKCRSCEVLDICGGGSLPHRFGPDGFNHPTVYCEEMRALIHHVRDRVQQQLSVAAPAAAFNLAFDPCQYEEAEIAEPMVQTLLMEARADQVMLLQKSITGLAELGRITPRAVDCFVALSPEQKVEVAFAPGMVAWQRVGAAELAGVQLRAVDGRPLQVDEPYLLGKIQTSIPSGMRIGQDDPWLRVPFGSVITFEDIKSIKEAQPVVRTALKIIAAWRPALYSEMQMLCRDVQFIRDPSADPDKIVSFSDNIVPGALYVSVFRNDTLIDPYELADSLVHEHRHQKLYLLERRMPLVEPTDLKVVSPWREDLRPPSGLLHAVFVFVELRRFWAHVLKAGPAHLRDRARVQLLDTDKRLGTAFATLTTCPLTHAGRQLAAELRLVSEINAEAA